MTSIAAVPIREALRRFLPAHKTLELQPEEMERFESFRPKLRAGLKPAFPRVQLVIGLQV